MSHINTLVRRVFARVPKPAVRRSKLHCETLERRDTPTFTFIGVAFNQLTFEGDDDPDNLLVTLESDGFLRHNLVQGNLASAADFDTSLAGDQPLALADVGLIIVAGRGGNSHIQIDAPIGSLLFGGDDDDTLIGSPADDIFGTGLGTDTFDGRDGYDSATFYSFNSVTSAIINDSAATLTGVGLFGGTFTATGTNLEHYDLSGTDGNDTLDATGFSGSVAFNALGGNNVLMGGSGNDHLIAENGDDTVQGNGGDDIIDVGGGANTFGGGSGVDSLRTPFVSNAILTNTVISLDGLAHPNHGFEFVELQGTDASAVVLAAGFTNGSIWAFLGAGNDLVIGTPNADRIGVGEGDNLVLAGSGDDFVYAGFGTNYVLGGDGNDSLDIGVVGNATLTDSRLRVGGLNIADHGFEAVNFFGSDAANVIDARRFGGPVYIDATGGDDDLSTGSGPDAVYGGDGDDVILTGGGNDVAGGGPGFDDIRTGAGDDQIDFEGVERVDGGAGVDNFIYQANGPSVVLTNTALTVDGFNTAPNHGLEFGALFAAPDGSTLDASRFSRGPITMFAGPGNDVLILGRFGGTMYGDPTSTDIARIVGTNGADTFAFNGLDVTVNGGDPVVLASLFYYVELDGRGGTDTFGGSPAIITGLRLINIESHLSVGGDETINTGIFLRGGSYADNGRGRPWTAVVDFGDGSGEQPLTLNPDQTFSLAHTFTALGIYTVRVTLTNDEGTVYEATFLLTVNSL